MRYLSKRICLISDKLLRHIRTLFFLFTMPFIFIFILLFFYHPTLYLARFNFPQIQCRLVKSIFSIFLFWFIVKNEKCVIWNRLFGYWKILKSSSLIKMLWKYLMCSIFCTSCGFPIQPYFLLFSLTTASNVYFQYIQNEVFKETNQL